MIKVQSVVHSELLLASFTNRGQVQNYPYGYKFYLHGKENSFLYEWFCLDLKRRVGAILATLFYLNTANLKRYRLLQFLLSFSYYNYLTLHCTH